MIAWQRYRKCFKCSCSEAPDLPMAREKFPSDVGDSNRPRRRERERGTPVRVSLSKPDKL